MCLRACHCRTLRPVAGNFCLACPGNPSPNPTWPDPVPVLGRRPAWVWGHYPFHCVLKPVASALACPPPGHSTQEVEVSTHSASSPTGQVTMGPPGCEPAFIWARVVSAPGTPAPDSLWLPKAHAPQGPSPAASPQQPGDLAGGTPAEPPPVAPTDVSKALSPSR